MEYIPQKLGAMITPTLRGRSRERCLLLGALGGCRRVRGSSARRGVHHYLRASEIPGHPGWYASHLDYTEFTARWFGTASASPSSYTALGALACLTVTVSNASRNFPVTGNKRT